MGYWDSSEKKQELKEAYKNWRVKTWRAPKVKDNSKQVPGMFGTQHYLCTYFKREYHNRGTEVIIQKLIEISKIKFKNIRPYDERRKKGHYCHPKHKCFACKNPAEVQHHIIQIQYGGYDNGVNRIKLCNMCHARIHTWMMDEVFERKEMEMVKELKAFC